MALKVGELFAILGLDKTKYDQGLQQAEGQAQKTADKMKRLGAAMTIGITAPLLALATKSMVDWGAQEKATAALGVSLKGTNQHIKAVTQSMGEYASALQKQTIYADEVITSGMALASQIGVQEKDLKATAKAAIGLASAYSLDLEAAFKLVGRAAMGQTQTLARYGIVLDTTASKEEQFQQLLTLGAQKFSAATAEAKTASGQIKQATNAMGEATEAIGKALAPIIVEVAGHVTSLAFAFSEIPEPAQTALLAVAALAAVSGPMLTLVTATKALGTAATATWAALGGPVTLIIAAVVAIGGAIWLVYKNWGKLVDYFWIASTATRNMFIRAWEVIVGVFNNSIDYIKKPWVDLWKWITEHTVGAFNKISDYIKEKLQAIGDFFKGLYDRVVGHSIIPDMIAGIQKEMTKLGGVAMVIPVAMAVGESQKKMEGMAKWQEANPTKWFQELKVSSAGAPVSARTGTNLSAEAPGGAGGSVVGLLESQNKKLDRVTELLSQLVNKPRQVFS